MPNFGEHLAAKGQSLTLQPGDDALPELDPEHNPVLPPEPPKKARRHNKKGQNDMTQRGQTQQGPSPNSGSAPNPIDPRDVRIDQLETEVGRLLVNQERTNKLLEDLTARLNTAPQGPAPKAPVTLEDSGRLDRLEKMIEMMVMQQMGGQRSGFTPAALFGQEQNPMLNMMGMGMMGAVGGGIDMARLQARAATAATMVLEAKLLDHFLKGTDPGLKRAVMAAVLGVSVPPVASKAEKFLGFATTLLGSAVSGGFSGLGRAAGERWFSPARVVVEATGEPADHGGSY